MSSPAPSWPNLRILWSFARPYRANLAVGLVLGLATSAMALATPLVTERMLESIGTSASVAGPVGFLLGLLVLGAAVGLGQWVLLGRVAERAVLDARAALVRRFLGAVVPSLQRHAPGELVTRVTSDTALLREAASDSLVGLVNATVVLVGSLVLMGTIDVVLFGVTLATVAVVGALFGLCMPRMATAQQAAQAAAGRLGGQLEGTLHAIRTVKASGAEGRQAERLLADARDAADHGIRAVWAESVGWTIAGSGIQLGIIVVLAVGAWRVDAGHLSLPALVAFLLYTFQLMGPVQELAQHGSSLQSGIASARRIRELDTLATEAPATAAPGRRRPAGVPTPGDEPRPDGDGPVIELVGVTAGYGPGLAPAVVGLDLAIPRRGHVAVVGPSGAGKTTLFSLLLRFLEPTDGVLRLDGRPYASRPHAEVRARLAYVEQEAPVVPGTLRDNVAFAHPGATDDEVRQALRLVRLDERVDALEGGLGTAGSSTAISGGERQRLALARALLRPADVLLLDEATAQVDGLTEAAIAAAVRRRAATGAVVTIAHRLSTVMDADTIVVMDRGRIRARGSHAELLASDDLYRSLVESLRIAATPAGRPAQLVGADRHGDPHPSGAPH